MAADDARLLIVGYATGTLTEAERARFERALAEHPEWLPLLRDARTFARLSRGRRPDDEPGPELLVDYVERRHELDAESVRRLESALERSPVAREALACLERTRQASSSEPWLERLWESLRASLLAPAPALGYLLLLVALPALWWGVRDGPSTVLTPTRIEIVGERTLRAAGEAAPPPLAVPPGVLRLELVTELRPEDLDGRDWALELADSRGRAIERWPAEPLPRTFEGAVRFEAILDTRTLRSGRSYTLSVVADAAGDPLDGEALFRRELRVEKGGSR